jgi:butyryl-CoA dehydrogenase
MNFSYSEEEQLLRDTMERFAETELAPRARDIDEGAVFPHDNLQKLARLGVLGMNLPEKWGGPGVSALGLSLAVEEVAAGCASTASALTAHFLATDAILLGGDDDQRQRYLPDAAAGRALGAFALTEPQAGSNPADLRARAHGTDAGYRLVGNKQFISNAGEADFIVVFAKTDPDAGYRGISTFVVPVPTEGLEISSPEKTMGLRGGHVFSLAFDCLVDEGQRLGAEGDGFKIAMQVLDRGRVEVASQCIGIARAAQKAALAWSKERDIGGQALAEYQGIQWMLADMATDLEAARLLTHRAVVLRESGERFSTQSAMAKLYASEMAGRVTDQALQIHGGYGYSREFPLERLVRDVRIMRIYEGASEVQRNIIAREILG